MRFSKIFVLALVLSVGWHLFWSLLFDLSLEEKGENPATKTTAVYYIGKSLTSKGRTIREAGTVNSVFPQFNLPKTTLIQPPMPSKKLPQVEKEILDKKAQEIAEYKTEITLKKDIEPNGGRTFLPTWFLPKKSSKEKEYPIQWETDKREVTESYLPPYPQWAEEKRITAVVTLKFQVSNNGNVKEVRIEKSSGEAKLDLLAIDYLRRWQFLPSTNNSESKGLISMQFRSKE